MAPHHDERERHGSHLPAEWRDTPERERFDSEDTAERLEMDRPAPAPGLTWADIKEAVYVVGGMVGFLLTGCATYYGVVGEIRDSRKDLLALTDRVVLIEHSRADVMPKFEDSLRNNALQDQRLQNLTEANARTATSVTDLARAVTIWSDKVGDMRENMGRLEERIGRGLPHDR